MNKTLVMLPKTPPRDHRQTAWDLFSHDADIGVRGYGETKEIAFEQAAYAMTGVMTDPEKITPLKSVDISCEGPDDALLLYEWLNALVYEMATRGMLFSRYAVDIQDNTLTGRAWGEPVDIDRHQPAVEIKGATLTELRISQEPDGQWTAQCVVDV